MATDTTSALLAERAKTHGDYTEHARCTQNLKSMMEQEENWGRLNACQREALHMIAHKIGRILTGNPDHDDHWADIAGYSRLVADRLVGMTKAVEKITIHSPTGPGTPEDGGQHARHPRYEDGWREAPPWPYIAVPGEDGDFYITNRRVLPAEDWEHLARLPIELTHKEWVDTLPEYRPLYIWDEGKGKYLMLAQRREHWGKEP